MPEYAVDIQETQEFTYHVKADSPEEAEAKALALHVKADDDPQQVHDEIVDGPTVTNCELTGEDDADAVDEDEEEEQNPCEG